MTTDLALPSALPGRATASVGTAAPANGLAAPMAKVPLPSVFSTCRWNRVSRPSGSTIPATQVFMCGSDSPGFSQFTVNASGQSFPPVPAFRQPHSWIFASRRQPSSVSSLHNRYSRTWTPPSRIPIRCRPWPATLTSARSWRPTYSKRTSASPPWP